MAVAKCSDSEPSSSFDTATKRLHRSGNFRVPSEHTICWEAAGCCRGVSILSCTKLWIVAYFHRRSMEYAKPLKTTSDSCECCDPCEALPSCIEVVRSGGLLGTLESLVALHSAPDDTGHNPACWELGRFRNPIGSRAICRSQRKRKSERWSWGLFTKHIPEQRV